MAADVKRRKLSNGSYQTQTDENVSADKSEKDTNRSLFVRSLPASITNDKLAEHFSQSYPLKHATVILDPKTKISRGFGFVTFTDAEDANAAAKDFNDTFLDGRKIKVEVAEARHREVAENLGGKTQSTNVRGEELRAQRQQQRQDNQPPKLIVRNLPWSIKTSEDLSKLFLSYGKIKYAVVPKLSTNTDAQAGFGIVILRGKKNAEKALEGVNGKIVDGRTLAVDWAVDKETWKNLQTNQITGVEAEVGEDDGTIPKNTGSNVESIGSEGNPLDAVKTVDEFFSSEDDAAAEDLAHADDDYSDEESVKEDDDDLADAEEASTSPSALKPEFNTENTTVFIRNLPFTTDDDSLYEHFKTNFGHVRYARVVYDQETERSRGTAFVCFRLEEDARNCVKNAPKPAISSVDFSASKDKKRKGETLKYSILQNNAEDPSGKYTLEGRVLQISRALNKDEADRRTNENSKEREKLANDKRRLYLLSEGTIPRGSKLYNSLGKAELDIREASAKQRQKMVKQNPNLGLSLTRLSVRNLPRWIDSKALKQLAREAIVEFAKDVREGQRHPLSKEEISRGGEADREAEKNRRDKGKGVVKQAKIVFESEATGGKVGEGKGGRSRGYGFIEYHGHRNALMGLRWLNGHLLKGKGGDGQERSKRLIVEFAIENAQVVQRRNDRESRARERKEDGLPAKRKRTEDDEGRPGKNKKGKTVKPTTEASTTPQLSTDEKNKIAMRNRVIAQKRHKRNNRKSKN